MLWWIAGISCASVFSSWMMTMGMTAVIVTVMAMMTFILYLLLSIYLLYNIL